MVRRLRFFTVLAVASAAVLIGDSERADAQFYRGPRGRGPIVVAPPIVPMPYLGDPFFGRGIYPPPGIGGPPSGVRVRTPFFSLNVDPGGYMPPRVYNDPYQSYRPRYDYDVPPPSGLYGVAPEAEPYRYRPGVDGGVPELTAPPAAAVSPQAGQRFSRGQLRRSAAMLRAALSVRGEEGQVWLDFLQPEAIVAAAEGRYFEFDLAEMARRYEGVTTNPDLGHIRTLPGFTTTRDLLAMWANQLESTSADPPQTFGQPLPIEKFDEPATMPDDVQDGNVESPGQSDSDAGPSRPRPPQQPPFETLPAPVPQAESL